VNHPELWNNFDTHTHTHTQYIYIASKHQNTHNYYITQFSYHSHEKQHISLHFPRIKHAKKSESRVMKIAHTNFNVSPCIFQFNNWQTPTHALRIQQYISLECWFQC